MKKSLIWRSILISAVMVLAIVLFLPSLPEVRSSLPKWWPGNKINLGLDLQGGMHLVYQVQTEKALESFTARTAINLKNTAADKKINVVDVKPISATEIEATLANATDTNGFLTIASDTGVLERKSSEGTKVVLAVKNKEAERIKTNSVTQGVETIRNRIDQLGVAEPVILQQGTEEILVQLPGIKDPQRALNIIGKTALLEFKIVDEATQLTPPLPGNVQPGEEEKILAAYKDKVPADDEILFEKEVDRETGAVSRRPYLVKKEVRLTGEYLTEARVSIDQRGRPEVSFKFDTNGAKIFDQVTGSNIGKRLAIVLDGNIYSAPTIQSRIGADGVITGNYSEEEAKDLAIVLRAGALPAPLKPIQNLTVGPTLGNDSISAGQKAIVLGALLVIVFMAVYYKMSGIIADFAIGLNIVLLIGALAALSATLTLPGLAGILLTIGMGVDSNVLIFERIREELRLGKSVRAAIDGGYGKAFTTVFDSHVTTLITAAVLFQFGTGPIKGFAVSLSLGIMINLFTALVGTKVVFDFITSKWKLEKLSI